MSWVKDGNDTQGILVREEAKQDVFHYIECSTHPKPRGDLQDLGWLQSSELFSRTVMADWLSVRARLG